MPLGKRQLFVYWRVATADARTALQAAREMQRQLAGQHPGLRCALYLRSDASTIEATLMESYAVESGEAAQGVDDLLQQRIEGVGAAAVQPWLRGARHVEVFEACDE